MPIPYFPVPPMPGSSGTIIPNTGGGTTIPTYPVGGSGVLPNPAPPGVGPVAANASADMSAYYYVTGPVHIYMRPARGFAWTGQPSITNILPLFVGNTESSPEPSFEPQYKPVFSSLSGEMVADEQVFLGTNTKVVLDLARFSMPVVNMMLNAPAYGGDAGTWTRGPGHETYLARGSLMMAQGLYYELWLHNTFYNTVNARAYPNISPGYHFYACRTVGFYPTRMTRDTKKIRIMVEAQPRRDTIAGDTLTFDKSPASFACLSGCAPSR